MFNFKANSLVIKFEIHFIMKQIIRVLVLFIVVSTNAQTTEENEVKATIEQFFEGFHQQDSSTLRTLVTKEVVLQSISVDNEGKTLLKTEDFECLR